MHRSKSILIKLGLTVTLAAFARNAPTQSSTPAAAPTIPSQTTAPTLHVYSRETVVDVTVTDAKGNPVHGLTQADFTVKEDNKPQPIRSFEEFAPTPAQPHPKLPPNVYTNLQPPPTGNALNILLLDFVNTAPILAIDCCNIVPEDPTRPNDISAGPKDLARALAAQHMVKLEATKYLQRMPPGTRVAVIGMSWPGSLRILQAPTSDPALLSAAVNTLDYVTNALVGTGSGRDIYEQFCAQTDGRDRMTIEVLQQIAADLVNIKGRKNLIWLSVGNPYVTDPSTHPRCIPDYSASLTRAYGLLTAAQVAVYPVDARGVITLPDSVLSTSGELYPNLPSLQRNPKVYSDAVTEFNIKTAAEQLAMESIAEATGGAAYYNTNDLATALGKAIDKGADYYTLSYVPPGTKYDGRYHKIKIEVDQSGLHLVYRQGYAAEDPAAEAIPPGLTLAAAPPETNCPIDIRAAMSRNMPTSQQILFDVQVEPNTEPARPTDPPVFGILDPKLKDKPLTRYGFEYALPARQITFTSGPNSTRDAALEFDIAAYNSDGKLVTSLSQSIKLPLTADQAQQLIKGPFRFFQQLDLPPGQLFLRIGILDPTSNKVGTLEIPLTIPKK